MQAARNFQKRKKLKKLSLAKAVMKGEWNSPGLLQSISGNVYKCFESDLISSGTFESEFEGPRSDVYFKKLSELLTRLPNNFDGQIILLREKVESEIPGFRTQLLYFEKVEKDTSYSHLGALTGELGLKPKPLAQETWFRYLGAIFGQEAKNNSFPDLLWERESLKVGGEVLRTLSLTELPQVTWKGCLQSIFETAVPFTLSFRITVPDRKRTKRQLETRRRVSHALSISSSLEIRNIESNSNLHSSEEILERILVNKESLFEISVAVFLLGTDEQTSAVARNLERSISGVGNAGLFTEQVGTLPVLESHLPGSKIMRIRTLPILSENLAEILPFSHDYSRTHDQSNLQLRSRSLEVSNLNVFSKQNINFNAFVCGATGAGKSFFMNAMLSSMLIDEPRLRISIYDVGGSYRRFVERNGGVTKRLSATEARALLAAFFHSFPVDADGLVKSLVTTLCGTGSHITHSHLVAIEDLVLSATGSFLKFRDLIQVASSKHERYYRDIAHWLKPHLEIDKVEGRADLLSYFDSQITAFDFRELDKEPLLQRATILLLSELMWTDLVCGKYPRTISAYDEVWKFFDQSKDRIEAKYRTTRKYQGGIISVTQSISDYGDSAFAKMVMTNSCTKIFLQDGAPAQYLRESLDLSESDISRIMSVSSKKPEYSEFFCSSSGVNQIFRLYPTEQLYQMANTENIAKSKEVY